MGKITMDGYIKLHRKILDNPIALKPNYLSIWLYLLLEANHKDNEIIWNNEKITVKRGQFIGSIFEISRQFSLSTGTVTYVLDYLKFERMVERVSNKRFTLFTILNYDLYQGDVERTSEIKLKSNRKQIETNNNDKKENKYNIWLETFNSFFDKKYKSLKDIIKNIDTLLEKDYTLEDYKKVLESARLDKWNMGQDPRNTKMYITPEFTTRINKFEQYLNQSNITSSSNFEYKQG